MKREDALEATAVFLRSIGLQVDAETGCNGFLEHVRIAGGRILYDPSAATASNLLHEAGHIATMPAAYRSTLDDDVEAAVRSMMDDLWAKGRMADPDDPLVRAALQCSDPEATAWAWAAGLRIGLPEEVVIMDHEYDGDGADLRAMLGYATRPGAETATGYLGIHGLAHAGFCALRQGRPLPMYPELAFWLQQA